MASVAAGGQKCKSVAECCKKCTYKCISARSVARSVAAGEQSVCVAKCSKLLHEVASV